MKSNRYFHRHSSKLYSALMLSALLSACGFLDDDTGTSNQSVPTKVTVATGAAVAQATVSAKCTAGTVTNVVTDASGAALIDFRQASLPCLVQASFTQAGATINMHSLVPRAEAFNITPLTESVTAEALRTANVSNAFASASADKINGATANIATAITRVSTALKDKGVDISSIGDPTFAALVPQVGNTQGNAHDDLLEAVKAKLPTIAEVVVAVRGNSAEGAPSGGTVGGGSGSTPTFTIGGAITGLAAGKTVSLQNNGTDTLTLGTGNFSFATKLASGTNYAVTVSAQPAGQTCSVSNGSGAANANISNITVTCATVTFAISGQVSGLGAGKSVVLQNNAGDNLTVRASGNFAFPVQVASGADYVVSVLTNPIGQTCTVNNAGGKANAAVINVTVTCSDLSYTIGGTLSGLDVAAGKKVTLTNNGGNPLELSAIGAFTFTTPVVHGANYLVAVNAQPAGQTCTVNNAGGTANAKVVDVSVNCVNNQAATFSIGGSYSGLVGTVVLQNNAVDDLTINGNGAGVFTFVTKLAKDANYAVTVKTHPVGQNCLVTDGGPANVGAANVANVKVACEAEKHVPSVAGAPTTLVMSGATLAGIAIAPNGNVFATTYRGDVGIRKWASIDSLTNGDEPTAFTAQNNAYAGFALEAVAANEEYVAVAIAEPQKQDGVAIPEYGEGLIVVYRIGGGGELYRLKTAAGTAFKYPRGVAFVSNVGKDLYIADDQRNRIVRCGDGPDSCVEFKTDISSQFDDGAIKGLAVDPSNGDVWVTNFAECKVLRYKSDRTAMPLSTITFDRDKCPIDIAIANYNNANGVRDILVTHLNNPVRYDNVGAPSHLSVYAAKRDVDEAPTQHEGPVLLNNEGPWGIAVSPDGKTVLVVDSSFNVNNSKLRIYSRP